MAPTALKRHRLRHVVSLIVAVLMISSMAYLGVRYIRSSQAATGGSMSLTASKANVQTGDTVSVAVQADSGADPVNAVQASLTYDTAQLQFVSMSEGTAYTVNAATSTNPGQIRVGRGTDGGSLTGNHTVVTVNFKMLASSGSATVTLDRQYSAIVRSSDSQDILQTVTGTAISVASAPNQPTISKPVFYLNPPSGTYGVGSTVAVGIRIKSTTTPITTVQPIINYPESKLSYVSIAEGTAFRTVQRTRTANGTIDLIRGISGGSAGVTGDHLIATVTFKVIADGGAALSYSNGSAAYDNSGTGTNILDLAASAGATYASSASATTPPPAPTPPAQPPAGQTVSAPTPPVTNTSRSGSVSITSRGGSSAVGSSGEAQLQGEVALTPLVDSSILANNPGDYITKVEYYLDNKKVASKTIAPFTYSLDTTALKNGRYTLTVKTYYKSGTVDTSTDTMMVSNRITFAYVGKHYWGTILASLVGLAAAGFIIGRFTLPRFRHDTTAPLAVSEPNTTDVEASAPAAAPASVVQSQGGLYAAPPTVIAPAAPAQTAPPTQSISEPAVPQQVLPMTPITGNYPQENVPSSPVRPPKAPVAPVQAPGAVADPPAAQSSQAGDRPQY